MDMNMPVMGGLDALRIYRMTARTKPGMPIIILTANATIEAKRECEQAGAELFLTKPIDASTLLDTVSRFNPRHNQTPNTHDPKPTTAGDGQLINRNTLHQLKLLGGTSKDFMEEVIQGFFAEGEQVLAGMRTALTKHEYATFRELAHTLKGSSGNVGAEALYQICREISLLKHDDLQASADQLLIKAQDNFASTRQTMIRYLEAPQQAIGP